MTTRRGFTLIEVLVAATIIALLTAIGVVSYASANRSARDAKRKSDLEQIRAALEMFRADCGKYPVTNTVVPGNTLVLNATSCPGYSGSTITYMQQIPQDPKYSYIYRAATDRLSYVLCAYLEGGGGTTSCSSLSCSGCGPGNQCNYKVCPP